MGLFDKLLDLTRYGDGDDYDEDDGYLDEEDDFDEAPRRGKRSSLRSQTIDDDDDMPRRGFSAASKRPNTRTTASGMEVCVIKPTSVEDSREITDTLLSKCTVVLNMEGLDMDIAQRIIDFTSGSTYAMGGNLQKIAQFIFLITPKNVDISGDFQEILSGAFDAPSLRNRF